ncbi:MULTISPECIES: AraC family transcriptional regulator [unclassified Mesorhizobium]|uniref:AraC family transcriptional regulator n=1 Tax=unclassified Mesorhizobium TaxID=325217 RepID=UPI0009641C70|nr:MULTISPECIES: AraC family transcriptional regulator [unclassified Mesorhizobium]MBN9255694.1 AraC family transcriptional regulator [Mesorhizobium sp.]MBN9275603.1 AraC family transcriptional regulator [Mesorhizobium sp.]OJX84112.1 MAG: AraC family transcriptional regulator [Mesorhizobium sp. 65-26]
MDPFSDVIALLRPSTAVAKPISGRGRWGVRYTAHDAPGFAIVLQGNCWLSFEGGEPVRFHKGDFLLLPTTPAFSLSSHPGVRGELRDPLDVPVRHGEQEGEPEFAALGGTFRIEQINAPLLLALLPSIIHIPASEARTGRLHRMVELITEECANDEPGKEMLLQRLLEILLVEALRWRGIDGDEDRAGLLRAMRDPSLARVLRSMHADVRANWTVAGLAEVAGLSRSAFAARFGETLGCGPIEYLARWRMALAKDALVRGAKTLDRIAEEIGYESASAFSTAFRRRLGLSPGRFAKASGPARMV